MPYVSLSVTCQGSRRSLSTSAEPLFRVNLDPEVLRPKRAALLARIKRPSRMACRSSGGWPSVRPRKGSFSSRFVGLPPDLVRETKRWPRGEPVDLVPIAYRPRYKRVAGIGHGQFSEMTPDQAIEVARVNEPSEPSQWTPEAQNVGLRRGDWVSVTPDDYGNAVYGSVLAWTPDEIVVRHEDPSGRKVNLRFPRVGFDVAPQTRQAA